MVIRYLAIPVCLALMSMRALTHAEEPAEARAIVERAIEAAGGPDALARYEKPFVRVSKGTLPGRQFIPTAFDLKVTALMPYKLRSEQTMATGETFVSVFAGDKGRTITSGQPPRARAAGAGSGNSNQPKVGLREMIEAGIKERRRALYAQWLATLLPLRDQGLRLTKVDEIVIDGRPAVGIKATREDMPDVELYFDKETFALVKLVRTIADRRIEEYYRSYGELDGLKYPQMVEHHSNGKKQIEMQTIQFKFLDEVEEGTFDKPSLPPAEATSDGSP